MNDLKAAACVFDVLEKLGLLREYLCAQFPTEASSFGLVKKLEDVTYVQRDGKGGAEDGAVIS
jgi:hypothetical protein